MAVCPEETANRVLQHSLSIPITMRAVINKGKGKIKQLPPDDSDIHVNSMNGLGHGLESMDTKSVGNLSGTRYKLEGGRGVVPGGGTGTPGTPACVKQESMEVDSDSRDKDTDSLNRVGPQEAGMECYTGALTQHQHLSTPDQQFRSEMKRGIVGISCTLSIENLILYFFYKYKNTFLETSNKITMCRYAYLRDCFLIASSFVQASISGQCQ